MATGKVKWFDPDKGFGFVAPDDGSTDRFVHRSGLVDAYAADLAEGDRISFEIGESPRGPVATQVAVVERSGIPARPRSVERSSYPRYGGSDYSSGYGNDNSRSEYGNARPEYTSSRYDTPRTSSRTQVSSEEIELAPVQRGTVKRYDTDRGFGFIAPDSGQEDVFVHHSALGGATIRQGDEVEFRSVPGQRGLRAERVQLIRNF